jgi:sugar/nucleoside kinase (ribokinase family)
MSIERNGIIENYMLFTPGEKLEIETLIYQSGGGATNTATSFKRLGFQVGCVCNIGNDPAGDFIIKCLESEGVEQSLIHRSHSHQTGVTSIIKTIRGGDQAIFAFRGANSHLELNKLPFDQIKQSNQLYITSLSNNSAQLLPDIVTFAKKHNVPIAINPGTSQLAKGTLSLKQSLEYIDILIVNSSEARSFMAALVGIDESYKNTLKSSSSYNPCTLNTPTDQAYLMNLPLACQDFYFSIPNFFKAVLNMGPSIVIVTNGPNGVYAATNNTIYFHPSIEIEAVDTIGAGDAFGSCFVASLLSGSSIQEALRNGIINSASVLEHIGAKAGLLTHQKLAERSRNLALNLLQTFKL